MLILKGQNKIPISKLYGSYGSASIFGQWNEEDMLVDYNKTVPEIANIVHFRSGKTFTESFVNFINEIFKSMTYFE